MRLLSRLVLAAVLAIGVSTPVAAATTTGTVVPPIIGAQPGQGLQLDPPLVSASANPGQTVTVNLTVRNISGGTLLIHTEANDFGAKGEDGEPQIFLDNNQSTRFSLHQWIVPIAPFTISSLKTTTIPVKIVVPANAEPGGHYGVIRFSGTPPDVSGAGANNNANLGLTASIGALVLFTVNGEITHKLTPIDVAAEDASGQRHRFFEYGPTNLIERIRNDGNVHELPVGTVSIKDLFGKTVVSVPFNDHKGNVLPDAVRRFTQTLSKKSLFGRYAIVSNVTYDNGVKLAFPQSTFWVIPWRLLLAVIFILLILFFAFRFGLKRYNQHIIDQARRRR